MEGQFGKDAKSIYAQREKRRKFVEIMAWIIMISAGAAVLVAFVLLLKAHTAQAAEQMTICRKVKCEKLEDKQMVCVFKGQNNTIESMFFKRGEFIPNSIFANTIQMPVETGQYRKLSRRYGRAEMTKRFQKDTEYAEYDLDGDEFTDEELAREIRQAEHEMRKLRLARMATASLGAMGAFTVAMFFVPVERVSALADISNLFYISGAGIVAYMGTTAW